MGDMVVEQEYQHAKLHHSAQGELKESKVDQEFMKEMKAPINGLRKMVLRRGNMMGYNICGLFECSSFYGLFFQSLVWELTGFKPGALMAFHLFEEIEHAALTVQSLKKKTTALERFLFATLYLGNSWMFPFEPFSHFMKHPSLLLKWESYPQFFVGLMSKT